MIRSNNILMRLLLLIVVTVSAAACNDSQWDELPAPIAQFIDRYFNSTDIESYTDSGSSHIVVIKNGSRLTFDSEYEWTMIDGRGGTLPQILISDQLPEALYGFLVNLEATDGVYSLSRTAYTITVQLQDTDVVYDRRSGSITYPSAP